MIPLCRSVRSALFRSEAESSTSRRGRRLEGMCTPRVTAPHHRPEATWVYGPRHGTNATPDLRLHRWHPPPQLRRRRLLSTDERGNFPGQPTFLPANPPGVGRDSPIGGGICARPRCVSGSGVSPALSQNFLPGAW